MLSYVFSSLRPSPASARRRRAPDFHFCRLFAGDAHALALARHQHYLCALLGLRPVMRVLNVGSGAGDAVLELVRYADVEVVGVDPDDENVQYATRCAREAGMATKATFVHADLDDLASKLPAQSFDAIFTVEFLKTASSFESIYSTLSGLLKPGGKIGVVDWCWTPAFDILDPDHCRLAEALELSAQLTPRAPELRTISSARLALERLGFTIEHCEDLGARPDKIAWYAPLEAALADSASPWLSNAHPHAFGGLSREAATVVVQAAKFGLFTPMAVFVAQKAI